MSDETDPIEVLRAVLAITPEDAQEIRADTNDKADSKVGPRDWDDNRPEADD